MREFVRCRRLRCVLLATACAHRHLARIASGAARGAPRFHPCGACPDGADVAARLEAEGWTPPRDSIPAELLDEPQRLARVRWIKSHPAYAAPGDERLDPLREAALAAPDDHGIEVDAAGLG